MMGSMARRRAWVFTLDAGWVWVGVALLLFWSVILLLVWLWLG
jgi:hypothetical protein